MDSTYRSTIRITTIHGKVHKVYFDIYNHIPRSKNKLLLEKNKYIYIIYKHLRSI